MNLAELETKLIAAARCHPPGDRVPYAFEQRVMARLRDMRGGKDNDSQFGTRMTGQGVWAQLLRQRFNKATRRLGLNCEREGLDLTQFQRPSNAGEGRQASLF